MGAITWVFGIKQKRQGKRVFLDFYISVLRFCSFCFQIAMAMVASTMMRLSVMAGSFHEYHCPSLAVDA